MSDKPPLIVSNSGDNFNKVFITLASLLLAVAGVVDIKNIDRTHEIVTQMKQNQEEFLRGLGVSAPATGAYFREIHDHSEDNLEFNQQILKELQELKSTLREHHHTSSAKLKKRDQNG